MLTIKDIHGLSTVEPHNPNLGIGIVAVPELVFGVELEIEEFDPEADRDFPGVTFTDDGSLRNSNDGIGIEAITFPVRAKHLEGLLCEFFITYGIGRSNYSERCSTHVHMNVQELSYDQLASLCLVYQTVEELLFSYVGDDRKDNIFCVPWNQCGLSYNIVGKIASYEGKSVWPLRIWQKYSALNMLPISEQGSIEFRHLGGTCDLKKIMGWINILSCIHKYSTTLSFSDIRAKIMNMNTVSNYREWMTEVFGEYADLLRIPGFEKQLSSGVVDSKLSLMGERKLAKRNIEEILNELRLADQQLMEQAPVLRQRQNPAEEYVRAYHGGIYTSTIGNGDIQWTTSATTDPEF